MWHVCPLDTGPGDGRLGQLRNDPGPESSGAGVAREVEVRTPVPELEELSHRNHTGPESLGANPNWSCSSCALRTQCLACFLALVQTPQGWGWRDGDGVGDGDGDRGIMRIGIGMGMGWRAGHGDEDE